MSIFEGKRAKGAPFAPQQSLDFVFVANRLFRPIWRRLSAQDRWQLGFQLVQELSGQNMTAKADLFNNRALTVVNTLYSPEPSRSKRLPANLDLFQQNKRQHT